MRSTIVVEERLERGSVILERALGDPRLGVGEDDREVGLLVVGPELDEQIEGFVDDLDRTRVAGDRSC